MTPWEDEEWISVFEEYGGYDCMSAAYSLKEQFEDGSVGVAFTSFDCPGRTHREHPETRARARLAAAAPELVRALFRVVERVPPEMLGETLDDQIHAALVKAGARVE